MCGRHGSPINGFCIAQQNKGIVLEAMGRGNVPPAMMPGIMRAAEKGIILVMVSRCPTGRVLGTYGYKGGGKELRDLGVIFGGRPAWTKGTD